ncbi:MAG TPA: curli assembly protein CsgF [Sphingobium sp.]|nr:curli assembly protein CsgF [Sphingobium sp.]
MPIARKTAAALVITAAVAGVGGCGNAWASDLVYTPNNPSFGGNPFNSTHLLGVANAINKYKDPTATTSSDPAAQFLRTLQSRLLSTLATQITDVIFGENAQESGLIKFGDQEISFVRGVDSVTLTISDLASGSVSEIVVPLLQGAG